MTPTMLPQVPSPQSSTPTIRRIDTPQYVLRHGPFPDRPYVWNLDFASGCSHACPFCPARVSDAPGDDVVYVADGLADQLRKELSRLHHKPEIVLIGLETDPFLPSPVLQGEVVKAIRVLSDFRITAWLVTRGKPLPAVLDALAAHRERVRVTVSLATVDPQIQHVLEPHAASVEDRLQLIADLQRENIPLDVNVEPLLPGLTDTRDHLRELLERLAKVGVRQITTGYLVLRPGVKEKMQSALEPHGWAEQVLEAYEDGPQLRSKTAPPAQYLSKTKRQRGYAALVALAAMYSISVRVGRLSNPDFVPPRQPDPMQAAQLHSMIQSARQAMAGPSAA